MKTKEQEIEFVTTESNNGNSVVMATLGNGGSGLTLLQGDCAEFIEELNIYSFDGIVEGVPGHNGKRIFRRSKRNISVFRE